MTYPFDPRTREHVAQLLYDAIPALYKLGDQQARHQGEPERAELERFVKVLAGPLAIVRQSIEELHADFFIDSANDWIIPYLARMIGLRLVFPDADSNRRDVRNAVGWRRKKGSPATLQELGNELTGQLVVTDEGWKQVRMAQDLDLLRFDRLVPNLRPPSIAERADGPSGYGDAHGGRPADLAVHRQVPPQACHPLGPSNENVPDRGRYTGGPAQSGDRSRSAVFVPSAG